VQDVRQAARLALESLASAPALRPARPLRPHTTGAVRWTSDSPHPAGAPASDGWQAALRASFGIPNAGDDPPADT